MRILLLFLLLLTGCASQSNKISSNASIPNGTWSGIFQYNDIKPDQSKHAGTLSLLLVACENEVRFWSDGGDGVFRTPPVSFRLDSYLGSHIISFKDAAKVQPDWVEIQSLFLAETSPTTAHFQWTRAVSNRDLDASDADRTFFQHGSGVFEHVSVECKKDKIESVAAKAASSMPPNPALQPTPAARLN